MTSETVELLLPCDVLRVNVVVSPEDTVTEVEQFFLRALNEPGIDSLESLTQLFGLGHRPTLDLVLGLWRNGYVEVREPGSVLALSPVAKDRVERDRVGELPSDSERTQFPEQVLRELVTGHYLEMFRRAPLTPSSRIIPTLEVPGVHPESRREELLELLMKRRRTTHSDREFRHLRAYVPLDNAGSGAAVTAQGLRYVRLLARAWQDVDTGGIRFDIVHPPSIPPLVRRDIGTRLSQLSVEEPSRTFFKHLQDVTRNAGSTDLDLEDAWTRLEAKVTAMAGVDVGNAPRLHDECEQLAANVDTLLEEITEPEQRAHAVGGALSITDEILKAITETRRQLVLVCPFLNVLGYQRLRDALLDLLRQRPVDVFLLWGVDAASELAPPVQRAFGAMRETKGPGRLHYVELPARTHAKMVLRDADWALVGSFNFLSGQEQSPAELAVVLSHPRREPLRQVCRLAEWAARIFPDYSVGRLIRATPSEFQDAPATRVVPRLSQRRAAPIASGSAEARAALAVWRSEWQQYVREAGLAVRGEDLSSPRARIVENEDHRLWLWRALETSRTRLVIASHGLAADVVDDRFCYTLRKRLEESDGPEVTLVYDRSHGLPALQALAAQFPERLHVVHAATHAKMLAWDDRALVSSFNFLSFEGTYRQWGTAGAATAHRGRGGMYQRVRSEMGVLLEGPQAYGAVVGALAGQIYELRALQRRALAMPVELVRHPVPPPRAPASALVDLLQVLEGTEDARQRQVEIENCFSSFGNVDQAWDAVSRCAAAGMQDGDVECCAAVVLLRPDARAQSEHRTAWLRWMAAKAWHDDRRFEAAVLLDALGDEHRGHELPRRAVAELACLLDRQEAAGRFLALASESLSEADRECLALCAALATIRAGTSEAAQALTVSLPAVEAPLRGWLERLEAFWRSHGVGLPLARIRERLNSQESVVYARECRKKLRHAFKAAMERNFDFAVGRHTWGALFGLGKPLAPLLASCESDDAAAAARWLDSYGEADARIADLMDRASEAGTRGTKHSGEYIDGGRRRALLGLLRDIVRAARDWVDAVPPALEGDSHLLVQALHLGDALRVEVDQVRAWGASRQAARHPAAPLVAEFLATLQALLHEGQNDAEVDR